MSKKFRLEVPVPCHENWNKMSPAEKGRYCDSCRKEVVDFSNMSDLQLAEFFKKPSPGSLCGRFHRDQLNREILFPKKRIPWIRHFFQFTLPAWLLIMREQAHAQGTPKKYTVESTAKLSSCQEGDSVLNEPIVFGNVRPLSQVTGKVVDDTGKSIPYATIIVVGTSESFMTDSRGMFKINNRSAALIVEVSAVGFETTRVKLMINEKRENRIQLSRMKMAWAGEVVVVMGYGISRKDPSPPLMEMTMKDTVLSFKVFPNPVPNKTTINIEWMEQESGDFRFELLDQAGRKVHEKQLWIDEEAKLLNMGLPSVTAGTYFIRLTHKRSKRSFAERIIIQ